MADLNKIVQRYEVQSDTSGLDKIAAAADKAAASSKKLVDAANALGAASDKTEKSAISVSGQLARQTAKYDEATKALDAYTKYKTLVERAERLGVSASAENVRVLAALKEKHEEAAKATNAHSAAVGLNRSQMMELGHVARSLFDDLGAGTLGFRSLLQEGGRISQVLGEGSGGVGGTLKAMGATVGRLATGWVGLTAGIVGGLALAGAAIIRFQSQQDKLALSLNGAGRFAGVNVAGLAGIANAAGARNPYLGQGGATDLAATLASTGRISASIMPGILDLAAPYARGTGQDLTKAGEELAKAFAEPSKGAEMLNGKLGFLDDRTRQLIASFERQGDLLGAQQALLGKAADETARMADQTWSLAKAWDGLTSAVARGANSFAEGVHRTLDPTLADKLDAALQARGSSARGPRGGPRATSAGDAYISDLRYGLAYQQYGETRLAGTAASDKATNDLSIQIGDAIRKALPEVDKTQELTDTLKLLDDALRNPETLDKVKGGAAAVIDARDRTQSQLNYANPVTRTQIESGLSAQALQAQTGVERTAIEARRAEIEVMAAGGSAALAAAKSLGVWNDEIAKSNKEAEDAARTARRDLDTSLMRPFERGAAEIRYRFQDFRRNAVTGPSASLSPDDLRMTALDPFGDLSDASKAFGGKRTNRVLLKEDALRIGRARSLEPEIIADHFAVPSRAAIGADAAAPARYAPGDIVVRGRAGGNRALASTSAAGFASGESDALGAYYNTQTLAKVQAANDELQRNSQLLRVRTEMFGKDTDAVQKAVAAQEIWNSLQLDDQAIKELGPARVAKLAGAINTQADAQVALNRQTQQYDQIVNASSWFQQTGNSVVGDLGSSFGDLYNANPRNLVGQLKQGDQAKYYAGQLSGSAVKSKIFQMQAGNFLRNLMFQQGTSLIQKGLFGSGQYGQPGYQSGLLGGVFNSVLGGFGIGGGGGGVDAETGAAFSNNAAGLSSLFSSGFSGFADGGVMTARGPLTLRRYASGGVANTPQLAMYGEGSRPEAYVPLADGRTIPVSMKGGGAPQISMGGHTIVVQGSADEKTLGQMRAELAASNRQMVADLQRNMGQMQAKWQQRNGS